MSSSDFIKIGTETVDITDACAMAKALTKVRLRLAAGQLRETVRIDGEEVTFQRADPKSLDAMVSTYTAECRRKGGGVRMKRTRFAKGIRFTSS